MIKLRVDELLKEKGKTPYWLSKQTGIAPNNISNICKGETTNIRLETMEKICKALDCLPNDLIYTDDNQLKRMFEERMYKYCKPVNFKYQDDNEEDKDSK